MRYPAAMRSWLGAAAGGVRKGEIVPGLGRPALIPALPDSSSGQAMTKRRVAGRVWHSEAKDFGLQDKVRCKEVFVRRVTSEGPPLTRGPNTWMRRGWTARGDCPAGGQREGGQLPAAALSDEKGSVRVSHDVRLDETYFWQVVVLRGAWWRAIAGPAADAAVSASVGALAEAPRDPSVAADNNRGSNIDRGHA